MMAETARRARGRAAGWLLLPALVAGAFAALVGLGTWQLDRLEWKRALIAERRAAIDAPAVEILRPGDAAALPAFRHVRLHGVFRHDKELLVGPRSQGGMPGWRVVTPLAIDTGALVLIDRGFVPAARKRPETREAGQVRGRIAVDGLLRRPTPPGWFTPPNDPARGAWFRIDPPAMAHALGLAGAAPFWVAAGPAANPGGLPAGGGDAEMPRNDHLQYAITWYALAGALLVVYAVFRRRQRAA